jgi:hypothetical protein
MRQEMDESMRVVAAAIIGVTSIIVALINRPKAEPPKRKKTGPRRKRKANSEKRRRAGEDDIPKAS